MAVLMSKSTTQISNQVNSQRNNNNNFNGADRKSDVGGQKSDVGSSRAIGHSPLTIHDCKTILI
jgi:hypothetical protein